MTRDNQPGDPRKVDSKECSVDPLLREVYEAVLRRQSTPPDWSGDVAHLSPLSPADWGELNQRRAELSQMLQIEVGPPQGMPPLPPILQTFEDTPAMSMPQKRPPSRRSAARGSTYTTARTPLWCHPEPQAASPLNRECWMLPGKRPLPRTIGFWTNKGLGAPAVTGFCGRWDKEAKAGCSCAAVRAATVSRELWPSSCSRPKLTRRWTDTVKPWAGSPAW